MGDRRVWVPLENKVGKFTLRGYVLDIRDKFMFIREAKSEFSSLGNAIVVPLDHDAVEAFCTALRRAVRGPLGALVVDAEQAWENTDGGC